MLAGPLAFLAPWKHYDARLNKKHRLPMVTSPAITHAVSIAGLAKIYAGGFQALKHVDLDIRRGEIFALLGPNGAGKTTLISIVCGIVTASSGQVMVAGHDIVHDYRITRSKIGLVP